MIVGLICARYGSEGLPGKNFQPAVGKPLIEWSIDQALAADKLQAVFMVTDAAYDHPIVPRLHEPQHLAKGDVAKWQVWQWAAAELDRTLDKVTAIVDIDVTRPIREPADIDKVVNRYLAPPPDCHVVMGVTEAKHSPYFDLLETDSVGNFRLSKPAGRFSVRQSGPKVYAHAGIYCVHRDALYRQGALFEPGQLVKGCPLPRVNALDIDDELDWQIVTHLLERKVLEQHNLEAAERWRA